jgi:putative ABC transport system permease protein
MEIRPILSALLRQKTGPLLVAIQVALSLAILANALFVVQQRLAAASRPSGIAEEANVGYLFVRPLQKQTHNEELAEQDRMQQVISRVPGVVSVAWTSQMPMARSGSSGSVRAKDDQTKETANPALYFVHDDLVKVLGLKLVEGRDFTPADIVESDPDLEDTKDSIPRDVMITQALGRALFPEATSYVGKSFYFGMGKDQQSRVVGVVERLQGPQAQESIAGEYSAILPMRISLKFSRFAVRTEPGQRDKVMAAVMDAVRKSTPSPLRMNLRSVEEDRTDRYRNERAMAWMLIAVSVLLLLVTVSGIVGMTTLRVAQRRKQIGVRRALGARWRDIMRYLVTENILITSSGIAAGLLLAIALNQILMRQLDLARLPAGYMAFGAVALWLLGILAVWGPASKAANTSPAIATRTA